MSISVDFIKFPLTLLVFVNENKQPPLYISNWIPHNYYFLFILIIYTTLLQSRFYSGLRDHKLKWGQSDVSKVTHLMQ